jgi:thiosulfate dehydrogenase [quinone] large subunit
VPKLPHSVRQTQHSRPPAASSPLLPIRLFVGWVMLRAALIKLADGWLDHPKLAVTLQTWLDENRPYAAFAGFIRSVIIPHGQGWSQVVAIGELVVGAALLAGLLTRAAAFGGLLLSLAFLLARGDGIEANPTAPFVIMTATLMFSHSGRTLGLDAALADRVPRWLT